MTGNWIFAASRTLGMARSTAVRRGRRDMSPSLDNLERRLSLSSCSTGLIVVGEIKTVPAIVGNHIGTNTIQGNHIGTNIQGNHIGTSDVLERKH